MFRTFCRIRDKLSLVLRDDIPEQFGYGPRAVAVEDHDPQALLLQLLMYANNGLCRGLLKKRPCLRVHRSADEVVGCCVTDIKFDGVVESDEFDQVSLAFLLFCRRRALRPGAGINKDKT